MGLKKMPKRTHTTTHQQLYTHTLTVTKPQAHTRPNGIDNGKEEINHPKQTRYERS